MSPDPSGPDAPLTADNDLKGFVDVPSLVPANELSTYQTF